jgi:type VI secretion system protein ImpG
MRLDHYFQHELRYLREQGLALASAHPGLSHYLGAPGADPDVERLLEGAAFLSASLHARIDDTFPELSHGVLELAAPHLLRVIPSMTMMQFKPIPHTISQPMALAAGCEMASEPLDGRSCRFRTCRPGWIYPADSQLRLNDSRTRLSLTLDLHTPLSLSQLALETLHLYLGDEFPAACQLYLWLMQHLRQWEIEAGSGHWTQPATSLRPVGLAEDEALLPEPDGHFHGHRLLQEYFSFPEAFLCVALSPSQPPERDKPVDQLTLHFDFLLPLPKPLTITANSLLLNCIPAINLFPLDAEPILRHGRHHEYPLHLSHQQPYAYALFTIDRVQSWRQATPTDDASPQTQNAGGVYDYRPFCHFRNRHSPRQGQYRASSRRDASGIGLRHSICFIDAPQLPLPPEGESVSISLTCCDRQGASRLAPGAIQRPCGNSPSFATFRNLLRPTAVRYPAAEEAQHWQLLSNLSHHYLTLLDRDRLQQLLHGYDNGSHQQVEPNHRDRIAAIQQLTTRPVDRLEGGLPIRGLLTTLHIQASHFASEGEIYLFGSVLARFFSHYASINSFHQLEVVTVDTQAHYLWSTTPGRQPLL